jgi:phage protein D/phage baseplate assembly protein gpV
VTTTDRVQNPVVKLATANISAASWAAMRSLRVELSLWMPNRCTIRFSDDDFTLTDANTFAIGKALAVEVPDNTGSPSAVFTGEITDVALEPAGGGFELVVGALDKSHRLASQSTPRSFANQTFSAIATTVAQGSGLTPSVTSTSPAIPYVVQTGTDFELLTELALRCGYEWWVDGSTLNFKKRAATAGPTLSYGKGLIDFRVRYSAVSKGKELTVRGWAPDTQQAVTATDSSAMSGTSIPGIGATSTFVTGGRSAATGGSGWAKPLTTAAYGVTDAGEAAAVATALASRADASEVVARGTCVATPALKPGKKVTIAGMGTRASGDYFVTQVEHLYTPYEWGPAGNLTTRFTAGNKAPIALADLVGGGDRGRHFVGTGLVVGQVTNIKDDPDGYGRVKCKFPALSTTLESAWCRVATPGGGDQRGFQFTPEVNDEVIVGFEHGDVRYPVILGGVWSKTKKPPQVPAESPFKTKQVKSKAGHVLEFGDGTDDATKHVRIELEGAAHKLRLGKDKFDLELPSGKPILIKAGDKKIEIDGSGNITVKGAKITLDAGPGDIELKGTNIKLTAQAGVDIKANAAVNIKGNAPVTVESSAITNIKGSMVKIN